VIEVLKVEIQNTRLDIAEVAAHAGLRLVEVRYDLVIDSQDERVGRTITEKIVVQGIALDATPVSPNPTPVAVGETTFVVTGGTMSRRFERTVNRTVLDVEQDWWSTNQGGDQRPP
jgi:hypothetical protein